VAATLGPQKLPFGFIATKSATTCTNPPVGSIDHPAANDKVGNQLQTIECDRGVANRPRGELRVRATAYGTVITQNLFDLPYEGARKLPPLEELPVWEGSKIVHPRCRWKTPFAKLGPPPATSPYRGSLCHLAPPSTAFHIASPSFPAAIQSDPSPFSGQASQAFAAKPHVDLVCLR
jgi:hypothetical protein